MTPARLPCDLGVLRDCYAISAGAFAPGLQTLSREPATLEDHVNRATLLGLGSEGSDQWDLVLGCSQPSLLHLDCRSPHAARVAASAALSRRSSQIASLTDAFVFGAAHGPGATLFQ